MRFQELKKLENENCFLNKTNYFKSLLSKKRKKYLFLAKFNNNHI